jgi:hypothetical protein
MGYFSDLIDEGLIERALEVRGKSKPTYWRQLTAGQRVELLRGQVVRAEQDAVHVMEVVLSDSAERSHRLVQMTLVTETGEPVYANVKQLQGEPAWLVEALVRLANEVNNDQGNG